MTVQEMVNELIRLVAENPEIADYKVVDADAEEIENIRSDEAYQELNLDID